MPDTECSIVLRGQLMRDPALYSKKRREQIAHYAGRLGAVNATLFPERAPSSPNLLIQESTPHVE